MNRISIEKNTYRRILVGDLKISQIEKKAVREVLDTNRLSEGRKVKEFEKKFSEFISTKYAILLSSGTSALIAGLNALLYLKDLKIKKGQKIITTPLSYIATANAIVLSGFEPVFVDIDLNNLNINPEYISILLKQAKNVSEYAAILPVHLMGFPCNMDNINRIAEQYELQVIEDSSQAHGTFYNSKKVGSLSLFSTFSFYIAHNIQVGEMGAITTNNSKIAELIRQIKSNGRVCDCAICTRHLSGCHQINNYSGDDDFDPRFTHSLIGYNFKANELSAAIGICQLEKADLINQKRAWNVHYLNSKLEKFSELFQSLEYIDGVSYLAYPIVIKRPDIITRKYLRAKLEEYGVESRPLFGCIPTQQPAYAYLKKEYEGKLPNAEYIGKNGFYIGCHQYLRKNDLDYIVYIFEKILKNI